MIVSYEVFEANRRWKVSMEKAVDEVDRMLYRAARAYSSQVSERAQEVAGKAMERAKNEIKKRQPNDAAAPRQDAQEK